MTDGRYENALYPIFQNQQTVRFFSEKCGVPFDITHQLSEKHLFPSHPLYIDFLFRIGDSLLHIEQQTEIRRDFLTRMIEYAAVIRARDRYEHKVYHVLFYTGRRRQSVLMTNEQTPSGTPIYVNRSAHQINMFAIIDAGTLTYEDTAPYGMVTSFLSLLTRDYNAAQHACSQIARKLSATEDFEPHVVTCLKVAKLRGWEVLLQQALGRTVMAIDHINEAAEILASSEISSIALNSLEKCRYAINDDLKDYIRGCADISKLKFIILNARDFESQHDLELALHGGDVRYGLPRR